MVAILFCVLYGIGKALSDLSSEGAIYPKGGAWKNKWLLIDGELVEETQSYWYYLWLYKPLKKERFPYSSTFLVSLTDFWHKTETLRSVSLILAAITYSQMFNPIIDVIILYASWNIAFSITYESIKRSKM